MQTVTQEVKSTRPPMILLFWFFVCKSMVSFWPTLQEQSQNPFRERKVIPSLSLEMEGKPKPLVDHKEGVLQETCAQVTHRRSQENKSQAHFKGFQILDTHQRKCFKASKKNLERPKMKECDFDSV